MGNTPSDMQIFAEGELEEELRRRGGVGDIGIKELLEKGYENVISTLVRPPRVNYDTKLDLGPLEFTINVKSTIKAAFTTISPGQEVLRIVHRNDFSILNDRELKLQCSHWKIYKNDKSTIPETTPCLIYLHSNIGSRMDALRVRDIALSAGLSVFAFDCSGSGLSDGIYVTMGWNEAKDLHYVLEYLDSDEHVSSMCLYAHSMGTFPALVNVATCTFSINNGSQTRQRIGGRIISEKENRLRIEKLSENLQKLPECLRHEKEWSRGFPTNRKLIKGMILDGAYASFKVLTEELLLNIIIESKIPVPTTLLKAARSIIIDSVKSRTEVDFKKLCPMDFVSGCTIPCLFIAGRDDKYVNFHHSEDLAAAYGGPSFTIKVKGDHYTARNKDTYSEAINYLLSSFL